MRPQGVSVAAIAAVVVVAGYFTIVIDLAQPAWPMSATGTPPPDGGAGNVLQPIEPGLAWHYRTEGIWQGGVDRVAVLGSERAEPSVTTIAEGVGPIEFDGPSYIGSGPLRLVDFRAEPPPLTGAFEAWMRHGTDGRGHETWSLELDARGGGTIGNTRDGGGGLRWSMRDGGTIEITAEPGGLAFRWTGRLESVGLLGTATFRDKRFVLEFVPR